VDITVTVLVLKERCLYTLLVELQQSSFGVKIDDIYCGAPAYADDLALVASSPEELQKMLDI